MMPYVNVEVDFHLIHHHLIDLIQQRKLKPKLLKNEGPKTKENFLRD